MLAMMKKKVLRSRRIKIS